MLETFGNQGLSGILISIKRPSSCQGTKLLRIRQSRQKEKRWGPVEGLAHQVQIQDRVEYEGF